MADNTLEAGPAERHRQVTQRRPGARASATTPAAATR